MENQDINERKLDIKILESIFHTSKKTVQEYVREIERHCRFLTSYRHLNNGAVLDDRAKLMDLYDAAVQQDAHLRGVLETLYSQILGERYMLARQNENGRYVKDVAATRKIQGTQFINAIRGIIEAKLYGYTGLVIHSELDPVTGKVAKIEQVERRNILPEQNRIVQRQGIWSPNWSFNDPMYSDNYILINNGDLGLFSATTPLILAKKFTFANYVNFSHTYGQPIIHGKTEGENISDRKRMASELANAAQSKVVVTGLNDEVDIKAFPMSSSDYVFGGLINMVDKDISNLILGSESMAGATQSYVGATRAHENIFRDRIEVYRNYIELVMNESIIPRLVKMGYIEDGLEFKYSKRIEMSDDDRIKLFQVLGTQWEMDPETVEHEFGIKVKRQLNSFIMSSGLGADDDDQDGYSRNSLDHMSDEEYLKRYGHPRIRKVKNFLRERR